MPRVVVVSQQGVGALGPSVASALRTLGYHVDTLRWGPWKATLLGAAAVYSPQLAFGFRHTFRRQVDRLAMEGGSDLVIVVKGALLDAPSIDYARRKLQSPIICWNPDSPFDPSISNSGAGIPQAICAYDAYITWADDVAERLRALCQQVLVVPFGWDPQVFAPQPGRGLAAGRIVFVGTGTPERGRLLYRLAHLRPLVYGTRWARVDGVEIHPPVLGRELCQIIGEAAWNINLLRPQNGLSHNMRTFELVGAGGNQVAAATADHLRFLGADQRTVLFQDLHELESILRSDPGELAPRSQGLLRPHTYVERVRQVMDEMRLTCR